MARDADQVLCAEMQRRAKLRRFVGMTRAEFVAMLAAKVRDGETSVQFYAPTATTKQPKA